MIEFWVSSIILIGFYITICVIILKGIRSRFSIKNRFIRLTISSILYSLLFGIGIIASDGGDPGFAFPVPMFLAIIVAFLKNTQHHLTKNVMLFTFWWVLIFSIMLIKSHLQLNKLEKSER